MVAPFVEGDILQIIFLAVIFGVALNAVGQIGAPLLDLVKRCTKVVFKILNYVMKLAPLGAFGAMAYAIGKYGVSTLTSLGSLIGLFYLTSAVFVFVVLGSVMAYLKLNIFKLLRYLKEELLLVFGTSTAEPALPGLMRKLEYAGVSKRTVGLVVPTGYSFNLDGAAIYLSLAAVYIAQATGTNLTIGQQLGLLGGHAADLQGRGRCRRRRVHRPGRHLEHGRHRPGGGHHADLRHRQVHVRVPGAGQLHRQRGRHPVRRQWNGELDVDRVRAVFAGKDVDHVRPQRGPRRQPVRPERHELVGVNSGAHAATQSPTNLAHQANRRPADPTATESAGCAPRRRCRREPPLTTHRPTTPLARRH